MIGRARAARKLGTYTSTGEGGYPDQIVPYRNHAITQVATGMFGVREETIQYAPIVEFKYAQGAKPGLGGHLLADKVTSEVAKMRESSMFTSLYSPFPFHSVYSVEDHKKHVDWIKTVNPRALVSVKVSTPTDVDMVAIGSYYAGANIIHIDGGYGGTGAAPEIAKKNIAMPIEYAIPKVHDYLVSEGVRDEITLMASGGIRTADDIAKAIALGADGCVVATAEAVAVGCTHCGNCERGRCGVVGLASNDPLEGKYLLQSLVQMRNRGNGKGGGIAALGLVPEQLGVSEKILREDYILQVAYLDRATRKQVEDELIRPFFQIDHESSVEAVDDYRSIPGLEVEPPEVYRYFVRVKPEVLADFGWKNNLRSLKSSELEDEFVYQNSYRLNLQYYSSLGEKKAFVVSHSKNLIVLKLVGYGDDVVKYYRLENFKAHVWIGHHRYPTKGRVWHPGGAHPFVGLHEALVHNGDFANYHSIMEYLAQRNIHPLFLTDTEVSVLLFDLISRVYKYPLEYLIEALAPTTERDFEMLPEEKRKIYRLIQTSHIHGSPDGPWFFIVARNDVEKNAWQLLGITDTSMLRPQVFALQEGPVKIGIIASERQAINAVLGRL